MLKNSTQLFNALLKELHFLIRKTSWDIYAQNKEFLPEFLPEDYSQELNMELLRQFQVIEERQERARLGTLKKDEIDKVVPMDFENLTPVFIELIRRERLHWLSNRPYTARRYRDQYLVRDCSEGNSGHDSEETMTLEDHIYSGSLGEKSNEINDNDLDEKLIQDCVFREISKYETRYPGVTRFLGEALNPSEFIWKKFEEYKSALKREGRTLRNMDREGIPPTVLLELLGESRNRLYSFKKVISFVYSDIGLPSEEIKKRWKPAELCFETRTI